MAKKNMWLPSLLLSILSYGALLFAHAQNEELQCYVQGECPNASFLPPTTADSYNRCLTRCQDDDKCQWFTFFPLEQLCMLMVSCPDGPIAECGEPCFSGEAQCLKQPPRCDVDGLWCEGPAVSLFTQVENLQECKDQCYQEPLCQWYNFDAHTEACLLTSACDASTSSCSTCVAGQKECLDKNADMDKLMIIGGYPNYYAVEVIDLSGNSLACPQLQNGPLSYAQVAAFIQGQAMMCAGAYDQSHCYAYENETDTWTRIGASMRQEYHYRRGVVLDDGRWWITGGYTPSSETAQTEIYDPEPGTFEPFTSLPRPANLHVILPLNGSATIFLGGDNGVSDDVWVYNWDTDNWTQMPSMPTPRESPAAGLAKFPDGSQRLVVSGGIGLASTDIFDFETNTWRQTTNHLPSELQFTSAVQFRETFLVVGGYATAVKDYAAAIFEFDPTNERWIEREETMLTPNIVSAFLVPDDYVQCV